MVGHVMAGMLPPEDVEEPEEGVVVAPPPPPPRRQVVRRPIAATRPATAPATQPAPDPSEQLPTTRPAPVAVPSKEAMAAARKQIWNKFREDYDKHTPGDRLALAHKLLKLAMQEDDPAVRFAMLREARDLAADVRDLGLTMNATQATVFFFDVDPVAEKLAALSAAAWPDDDEDAARAVIQDWLALSNEAAAAQKFDAATTAAAKAVAVARHWGDEAWVAEASRHLDQLRHEQEQATLVETARKTLAAHPDDPPANLLVGCHLAASQKWDEALPLLEKSSDPAMKMIAHADRQGPTKPGAQINLGDDWLGASQQQPALVREAFQRRARHWYAAAAKQLSGPDQEAVRQRMRGLPGGTIFEITSQPPHKIAALGGPGGGTFDDSPNGGGLLTGVRVTIGPVFGNPCLTSVQPLFRTESGKAEGSLHGQKTGDVKTAEAKAGYAVGAVVAKTGLAVDGFKLVFMRVHDMSLDPKDKYESEWFGGRGGSPETTLGGDGKPLVGIHGRSGDGLDAIGVLQAGR